MIFLVAAPRAALWRGERTRLTPKPSEQRRFNARWRPTASPLAAAANSP